MFGFGRSPSVGFLPYMPNYTKIGDIVSAMGLREPDLPTKQEVYIHIFFFSKNGNTVQHVCVLVVTYEPHVSDG